MRQQDFHITDDELLRAADGEIPDQRRAAIRAHLAACWTCRARMAEIDNTIASYVQAHRGDDESVLPPPDGARALLKLRMAEMTSVEPEDRRSRALMLSGAVLALLLTLLVLSPRIWRERNRPNASARIEQTIPNPLLTPGATLPVSKEQLCAETSVDTVRVIPVRVARQVFASYGIHEPEPRAYELDYLITPALGGGDNIRNFWPQPYGAPVWNAHVKDALEDHLHRLVCQGDVDLATAQRDIASDWTAAYRKYFRTNAPLPEHARFVKDRPWE